MEPSAIIPQRRFSVIEPDPIISMDLVGALKAAFPQSSVDVSQIVPDVFDTLGMGDPSLVSILLNAQLLSDRLVEALGDLVAKGAKVIVLGRSDVADLPASFLDFPFTTEMVLESLT